MPLTNSVSLDCILIAPFPMEEAEYREDFKPGKALRPNAEARFDALRARGLTTLQIGSHAGAADTALMLAVDPSQVRPGYAQAAIRGAAPAATGGSGHAPATDGIAGDPRPATAALGQIGVDLVVARTVADIRQWKAAAH